MSVISYIMGRTFMAPRSKTNGPGCELWINFGWNTQGNQRFPDYVAELAPVIDATTYQQMCKELQEMFNKESYPFELMCMCMLCAPCTLCLSCCAAKMYANKLTEKAREIVERHSRHGKGITRMRLELIEMAVPTGDMGVDQYGQPLQQPRDHKLIWPPLGYNIIVSLPERVAWPPTPGAPVQATMVGATATVIQAHLVHEPHQHGTSDAHNVGGASGANKAVDGHKEVFTNNVSG